MASIPRTDTPGYRQLHVQVGNALDRLQEAPDIEFKESASWDALKWKIIKTALAMGNLRDGGILIVGVAERTGQEQRTGIGETDLATYVPDNIADQFGSFISPGIDFTLVQVPYRDKDYLSFEFQEFREIPLVCKQNGPDGEGLVAGAVYVRPREGRPRSTKVTDAAQMRELLDLAADKAARRIIERGIRAGLEFPAGVRPLTVIEQFDRELEGL